MLRYVGYAFIAVALVALAVWAISWFIQPILPSGLSNSLVLFFIVLVGVLGALASFENVVELFQMLSERRNPKKDTPEQSEILLFSPTCGDKGIELAQQRLLLSSAFGTYFTGLLERDENYVHLKEQIELPASVQQKGLEPLQSIFWELQRPGGAKAIIIAAEGGMGKSTLAAKIIKCLYRENAIDMILGDSAKTQEVNPVTGAVTELDPAYYSPEAFYERICTQLGLPYKRGRRGYQKSLQEIQDRLEGRRALIVADNLETVAKGTELFNAVRRLATRDTRVIVTTRNVSGLTDHTAGILVLRLRPIRGLSEATDFIKWHIRRYANEHPDLARLAHDIENKSRVQRLLERTGGIPLLIQLVISDVARSSWNYVDRLPQLFGKQLLDFLYRERWEELSTLGEDGLHARKMLFYIAAEQYKGKKITFDRIREWAEEMGNPASTQSAIRLLQERFLIVNHESAKGNLAIFPSLAEFLKGQDSV